MALYAVDDDDLIFAPGAEKGKVYWCLDCFGPVKMRRGKGRLAHFYHIHPAPNCRLYSKTEDHLLAQLDLQKRFAPSVLQIERPFLSINRVADLCWESEKIVFEIQCSPITPAEAEQRIRDYRSAGYEVVWLLDDKRFNKRTLRPAEALLRRHATYYLSIAKNVIYDQFEIFAAEKRVRKSRPISIDPQRLRRVPTIDLDEELLPQQILNLQKPIYFFNDRYDRALKARFHPHLALSMRYWRTLEIQLAVKPPNRFRLWLSRHIEQPYEEFLQHLLQLMQRRRY